MKIDDPQVQKYISGQMSSEEEHSFRAELANHPEVADLADTLKRTAKLIRDDKKTGETPYGLNLSEAALPTDQPSKKTTHIPEDEIPKSGLAFYSYKLMGNSWRLGVTILSLTLATLILLLVVVPFLRTAVQVQSSGDLETEFQKLIKEQKENESKEFITESTQIPMHGRADTAEKVRAQDLDIAGAFDIIMDPSKKMLSAETVEQISELGKIGLTSPGNSQSTSLPLSYETEVSSLVVNQLKMGVRANAIAIQPDAWMNNFVKPTSLQAPSAPEISYRLEPAPWSATEKLLFVQVRTPAPEAHETFQNIWVYAPKLSGGADGLKSAFQDLPIKFSKIENSFSLSIDSLIMDSLHKNSPLILWVQSEFTLMEAELFRKKLEQTPKVSARLIWGLPVISESGRLMRSFFANRGERGFFIHAPTPTLVKKGLDISIMKSPVFWTDVRIDWIADTQVWASSQVVGLPKTESRRDSMPGWLGPGESVLTAIRLEAQSDESLLKKRVIGKIKIQYRDFFKSLVESKEIPTESEPLVSSIPKENVTFAGLVLWLGLGLKQEIEVTPDWISLIENQSQTLVLQKELQPSYQEFMTLLNALK